MGEEQGAVQRGGGGKGSTKGEWGTGQYKREGGGGVGGSITVQRKN